MSYTILDIIIYPVKSMSGISLTSARALFAGFEHDRRWMLLDENNVFITQRQIPQLALFKPLINNGSLIIEYQNEKLEIGLDEILSEIIETKVFDDAAITIATSRRADDWLSTRLEKKVRLVKIHSDQGRYHHNKKRNVSIPVSLADGYPYLVAGTSSLELLNSKLTDPVPMNRFRPNIVLNTSIPHIEDELNHCDSGDASFINMKPCGRCTIVTIDQSRPTINNETLTTLNTYRKSGNSVLFGTNMMCTKEGIIRIGDKFCE
ncbi:MAG: MOSC domain-containing protein [Saprospiraceae bacterium]|nr:MOSC domain-containing protein [Saprospiraceae bacterium]